MSTHRFVFIYKHETGTALSTISSHVHAGLCIENTKPLYLIRCTQLRVSAVTILTFWKKGVGVMSWSWVLIHSESGLIPIAVFIYAVVFICR